MSFARCLPLAALLLATITGTDAANILGVFPFPGPSHLILMNSLMTELALQGHHVTMITAIPIKKPPANYTQIPVEIDVFGDNEDGDDFDPFEMLYMGSFSMTMLLWGVGGMISEAALTKPNIQEFIKSSDHKFDVVITEAFFMEAMAGFAHKFQAPLIQICPFGGAEWMGDTLGNPYSYSYMPDFRLSYSAEMTFLQRMHNTLIGVFTKLGRAAYYIPNQNAILQKAFAGVGPQPVPHLSEIESRTSLLLLNHHVSLSSPKPYVPNIVEVGGMHIKPAQKLPKDLQEFLDSATEGVVYFSMGSNLQSSELPLASREGLLKTFSQLKLKVLWKWEEDVLPGQPANVKLGKWLPQSDLLAHPNIKVFITHGGLLSTEEAVYNGVPVIGIPVFGDQKMNMKMAVNAGYGRLVNFKDLADSSFLSQALHEVLETPTYRDNAREISRRFRDRPRTPLATAVFWVEYVIRHKGAYHMRSAAIDLAWYQYYLLDVIALIGGVLLALIWLTWIVLRTLVRCVMPRATPSVTHGKKNK